MIRRLTPADAHLQPVSLLLQQLVNSHTKNLSLFVTKTGRAVFVSCAAHFLDEDGIYRGSISVGWARGKGDHSGRSEYSVCSVAVGGKDRADVLELVDSVHALALAKPTSEIFFLWCLDMGVHFSINRVMV